MSYLKNCNNCVRKDLCQLLAYFNHNENAGCIDFQEINYQTSVSNTLNEKEELELL